MALDPAVAFCDSLAERFPDLRPLLAKHREDHDGTLPHVFMGDVSRWFIDEYRTGHRETIEAMAAWLDDRYPSAGAAVQNVIDVSFLENLPWSPDPDADGIESLLGPRLRRTLAEMRTGRQSPRQHLGDSTMRSDGLVEHLESFLGPISGGWSTDESGQRLRFQVVRFDGAPDERSVTYLSLGLSRHELGLPTKTVREELLVSVHREWASDRLASVISTIGEELLGRHRALLRGEILPPREPITPGSQLAAFYAAAPVLIPDAFGSYAGSTPPTVFVWLVPITATESELVASHGWEWFESQLEAQQPDLLDLGRDGIVH